MGHLFDHRLARIRGYFHNLVEMSYIKPFICTLFICIAGMAAAQEHPFYMYGEIWDMDTRHILVNTSVKATDMDDSTRVLWGRVDGKGRFDLELPFDHVYKVEFMNPGYVSKFVLVDLNGVAPNKRRGDHGMNVQPSLMRPVPGLDYTPFAIHPFGFCRLNQKGRSFEWDKDHSPEGMAELQMVLDLHTGKRGSQEN
jgi:hypothetical protein